ncbi:MAG: DUF3574 domain-containing protein [Pyrinomonadaceae bacterium]
MKGLILSLMILVSAGCLPVSAYGPPCETLLNAGPEKFLRTELFFGMAKPDGTEVTAEEWDKFVEEVIVPAFPDGFTVVAAEGRFRGDDGRTVAEKSRLLIVLYPKRTRSESSRKIDVIRTAYLKRFDQKSVLRMDLPGSVNVSFE